MKMVIPSLNLDGRTLKNLNSMQVSFTAANAEHFEAVKKAKKDTERANTESTDNEVLPQNSIFSHNKCVKIST